MDSAYDPTINRAEEQPPKQGDTMSIPAADKGAAAQQEGEGAGQQGADPTLEEEVKQLVGSVTSWWSGFSKKSAEQISTARAQIEKQGGLVSYARNEAAKLEAQLSEAQRQAREKAQATGEVDVDVADWSMAGVTISPRASESEGRDTNKGKGKGKGRATEDDEEEEDEEEDAAVKGSKPRKQKRAAATNADNDQGGEAIFDAENDIDEAGGAKGDATKGLTPEEKALEAARQGTKVALANMQSFWERIQTNLNSDPRIKDIQKSLASTLQSVSAPTSQATGEGKKGLPEQQQQGGLASAGEALPALARTLQSRLPHLDWKESQALAKKYYAESQSAAKDWTREMGDFVGELVKIVPPEEEKPSAGEAKNKQEAEPKSAATATVPAAPALSDKGKGGADKKAAVVDEKLGEETDDDFDWDREADRLETTTGPPTTSWGGSASGSEEQLASAHHGTATSSKEKQSKKDDDDEDGDSDWE